EGLEDRIPGADAMLATGAGIALAVLTADCVPVVAASAAAGILAVAHAGWRGIAAGVVGTVAAAFDSPKDVRVAIGPAVGPDHYEVGEDVALAVDAGTAAAARAGRDPADVTLIGVTKTLPARVASWAVEAGLTDLGENYVQELAEKRAAAAGARWHFIGRLQSRTANRVADLADVVHSAVPGRALERLARRAA